MDGESTAAPKKQGGFFSRFSRSKDGGSQEKILEDNADQGIVPLLENQRHSFMKLKTICFFTFSILKSTKVKADL